MPSYIKNILSLVIYLAIGMFLYQLAFDFIYNPKTITYSTRPAYESWKLYTNERLGFSIEYPAHYFVHEHPDGKPEVVFTEKRFVQEGEEMSRLRIGRYQVNKFQFPDRVQINSRIFIATHAVGITNIQNRRVFSFPVTRSYFLYSKDSYYLLEMFIPKEWLLEDWFTMNVMLSTFSPK